jgi:hypothetical protein
MPYRFKKLGSYGFAELCKAHLPFSIGGTALFVQVLYLERPRGRYP